MMRLKVNGVYSKQQLSQYRKELLEENSIGTYISDGGNVISVNTVSLCNVIESWITGNPMRPLQLVKKDGLNFKELKTIPYVDYKLLPQGVKDKMHKIWAELLGEFCPEDIYHNRPCDDGCFCSKCQCDHDLELRYTKRLFAEGIFKAPSLSSVREAIDKEVRGDE